MTPKESDAASLKQDDIVMLALGQLGGAHKKVFSEDIAAAAHELAPQAFGWQLGKYRERGWPDKEMVRKALVRLHSAEGGHLVEGHHYKDSSLDGWSLTPQGVTWLREHEGRVRRALQLPAARMPKRQAERFTKQIRQERLLRLFKEQRLSEASRYNFTDMLNCTPDASREVIQAKFTRLRSMAELAGQQDVLDFLDACQDQFGDLLEKGRVDPRA